MSDNLHVHILSIKFPLDWTEDKIGSWFQANVSNFPSSASIMIHDLDMDEVMKQIPKIIAHQRLLKEEMDDEHAARHG